MIIILCKECKKPLVPGEKIVCKTCSNLLSMRTLSNTAATPETTEKEIIAGYDPAAGKDETRWAFIKEGKLLLPHEIYEAGKLEMERALELACEELSKLPAYSEIESRKDRTKTPAKCWQDYFINKSKEGEG